MHKKKAGTFRSKRLSRGGGPFVSPSLRLTSWWAAAVCLPTHLSGGRGWLSLSAPISRSQPVWNGDSAVEIRTQDSEAGEVRPWSTPPSFRRPPPPLLLHHTHRQPGVHSTGVWFPLVSFRQGRGCGEIPWKCAYLSCAVGLFKWLLLETLLIWGKISFIMITKL